MPIHFFVRLKPQPGMDAAFREALLRVLGPARAEAGCLAIRVFESLHAPHTFAIHSEWADEAAFELHAGLPHTREFLDAAAALLSHPIEGWRSREIGV